MVAAVPQRKEIVSRNKASGEEIGRIPAMSEDEARSAVERARAAQPAWAATSIEERGRIVLRFRDLLIDRAEEVAELISRENGKTRLEAISMEVAPVADLCTYFAKHAREILAPRPIHLHLMRHRGSYIHYKPRGVVLVISPWNFPFSIAHGEIVMALLAGNTVVHKPASLTPLIALRGADLLRQAGLPPGVLEVVPAPGPVGSKMIEMGVGCVNFTGSTAVGQKISETCGRLMIPCSLELGGKDPVIVCADADLDRAANACVWGAFANSGQVCASVERVYALAPVYDRLVEKIVDRARRLRQGDPLRGDTDVGAMTDAGQIEIIEKQVEEAVRRGAKVVVGGKRGPGPGQFFEPTVIVDATDDMEVVREETFGPVLPILRADSEEDAIRRANDSIYGLNAYVFTRDREKGRRIAEKLEAGTVMINEVLTTHAAPETPWGGVKKSGMGRVHSDDGMRALCEPYHVNYDRIPGMARDPFWYPYSDATYSGLLRAMRLLFRSGVKAKLDAILGRPSA